MILGSIEFYFFNQSLHLWNELVEKVEKMEFYIWALLINTGGLVPKWINLFIFEINWLGNHLVYLETSSYLSLAEFSKIVRIWFLDFQNKWSFTVHPEMRFWKNIHYFGLLLLWRALDSLYNGIFWYCFY